MQVDSICEEDEQDERRPLLSAQCSSCAGRGAHCCLPLRGQMLPSWHTLSHSQADSLAFHAARTKGSAEQPARQALCTKFNTLKPEERHLFMLDLNLAPCLPEDWRTCHVGFWPALCRLDLQVNECQGYFTHQNTLCIMCLGCGYCGYVLGCMLPHFHLPVASRTNAQLLRELINMREE